MYTVFVVGGIASGKSSVAQRLAKLGGSLIDLDAISRQVLVPGSACLQEIAAEFGEDLIEPQTGELIRSLLAERAFASSESTARLEHIEHPYIKRAFIAALEYERVYEQNAPSDASHPRLCVVEVQLLDRALDLLEYADETIAVVVPYDIRRERALARGMKAEDFERRMTLQPSDDYLIQYADYVIENAGSIEDLDAAIDTWWQDFIRREGRGER